MDMGSKHVTSEEFFHFVTEEVSKDLGDGEAPISNPKVCAGVVVHKDNNICLEYGEHERFRVRDVTFKNLGTKLQISPPGPFDRTNISWEDKINQGRGRNKNTCKTIILHPLFHI